MSEIREMYADYCRVFRLAFSELDLELQNRIIVDMSESCLPKFRPVLDAAFVSVTSRNILPLQPPYKFWHRRMEIYDRIRRERGNGKAVYVDDIPF